MNGKELAIGALFCKNAAVSVHHTLTNRIKVTMKFVDKIKKEGYLRYRGAVDASVYEYFNCDCSWKAIWYLKDGHYQCCGCKEKCETSDPDGFQLFLDLG